MPCYVTIPIVFPASHFAFFLDFSLWFSASDHFFRHPWVPLTFFPAATLAVYHFPIKIHKKHCFDLTLCERAYKAIEWEAKTIWVVRGVSSDVNYFFRLLKRELTGWHLIRSHLCLVLLQAPFKWWLWKTPDMFCILFLKNVELASYHPSSCLILLFMDTAVNSNLIYL